MEWFDRQRKTLSAEKCVAGPPGYCQLETNSNSSDIMCPGSSDKDDLDCACRPPVALPTPKLQMGNFSRECDRCGVSYWSAAAIATAVLWDVGVVKEEDSSQVTERSKIQREWKRLRKDLKTTEPEAMTGLYFDGRKDQSKIQVKKEQGIIQLSEWRNIQQLWQSQIQSM